MGIGQSKQNVERMESRKDVEGLIKALEDKDLVVRAGAATALGRIKDEREKESWGYFGGKEDMYMITDLGKEEVKNLGQMQLC